MAPSRLEIEITETAFLDEADRCLANVSALRQLGISVALDDFGTGYSSLTYLRKLSPDRIKIDGMFVRDLERSLESRAIVKSLVSLSRDLRIGVVAECIENAEQIEILRSYHCDEGQGNLLSPPMRANDLSARVFNVDKKINAA